MKKLLIFDLDGTLINSIGGIAESVNRTRKKYGFAELPTETVIKFVGNGAKKLIERSLADIHCPIDIDEALNTMVDFYAVNPLWKTFLYPGVKDGLQRLSEHDYILTVVSNKPQIVSEKILDGLGIMPFFAENIGGGGEFPLKPDPAAMLYLLKKYNADIKYSFVIGDNYTDLNSAANAGMKSIFCEYGFGEKKDCNADKEVNSFEELTDFLIKNIQEKTL